MLQELMYGRASPISPFLKNTAVSAAACDVCSHALLLYCQEVFPNNFPNWCLSLLQIKLISSSRSPADVENNRYHACSAHPV